ncbi:MAG: hypothetical protein V4564_17395 [Pseudomonadota bacterium]|uniref:hypothetical protein n=1 Tax=Sphingomonas sp. ERG5 TaxID=1381597 RepID=UPI00054C3F99|nr:hypothetical protein [Sphingomonas sp. ERG5]
MRITTMMSVAVLGLSTAALANMTTAPGQSTTNNIITNNAIVETPMTNDMPMDNAATRPTTPAPNGTEPK